MNSDFIYKNEKTREISFPLGGIGTGCIGLSGNGRLCDFEIFNRPNKGSLLGFSHFAVKAEQDGEVVSAKVLNGDLAKDFMGQYQKSGNVGYGFGPQTETMAGFPHFKKHAFTGEFPMARIDFSDEVFPAAVSLTAFNPLIPLDDKASSLAAAFFEVCLRNTSEKAATFTAALSVTNSFSEGAINRFTKNGGISLVTLGQDRLKPDEIGYGDITFATDAANTAVQENWYRGGWFDGATVYWQDFGSTGALKNRTYENAGNRDTATLSVSFDLNPQEEKRARFVVAWSFPNQYNYWNPKKKRIGTRMRDVTWKNYYATQFLSSRETAAYCLENWDTLYNGTRRFHDALFSSTLPREVLDAVSANLSVLKSPVVLRLEDGSFYGWEGVNELTGSCEGSCTHVWNYAYALPFLFPALERSMRELDFKYNQWDNGRMSFRLQLPVGRQHNLFHPCVDGQMGAVIKTYRDWKLCGDDEWLKGLWDSVKKALEYAWHPDNDHLWDKNKDGVLEGRQHHTLDMELFGPSGWLQSFYLAALKAGAEMADYLGEQKTAAEYRRIFESGKAWSEKNLFNGEYFIHKIDLEDRSILAPFYGADRMYWNDEAGEIKYQIGEGSSIDQVCGQWHANVCGLGEILDNAMVKSALQSIYKYNYKPVMRDFFNPCRVYALNGESGTVICAYPEHSNKPAVPVPYTQECMTGFEYQAAAHMISEGMIEEGLSVVRGVRDRYDGEKRNPWNEIECGSNYARSMASFTLLTAFSGFSFDLPRGMLGFNPVVREESFSCLWSVGSGWGTVEITDTHTRIELLGGTLTLKELRLPYIGEKTVTVTADGKPVKAAYEKGVIEMSSFAEKELIVIY